MSTVWPGTPYPLGATVSAHGVNFALWSAAATGVELCLFDDDNNGTATDTAIGDGPEADRSGADRSADDRSADDRIAEGGETRLPLTERTHHVWHGFVPGLRPGQRYGFRVHGDGPSFDPSVVLVDPYARAIAAGNRSVVVAPGKPAAPGPRVPWPDMVVYELHVRGYTMRHPDVPEDLRGTYAGLAHPAVVAYLKELGVTSVELMPVHQAATEPLVADRGLTNYWGYNTLGFFAPDARFSASGDAGGQVAEFRAMVDTLHGAGLEVILDVVYNHTAEGGPDGPTLSLRGIDNATYYRLDPIDPTAYVNHTGTGNTLDLTAFPALRLVLDSLRYWVTEMGVDGFRFDLAPALARDSCFLAAVRQDPVLSTVKLLAEPWDLGADGYRLGRFGPPWAEWNGRFRDAVRDFWRGQGAPAELARRLAGSEDLFAHDDRTPQASINFITAHDGFTMRDLVSYAHKHNEANGEDDRDGTDDNRSDNLGVEGPSPELEPLRLRQVRNLLTTLLLSTGVPMLLAGDELGRTQQGNNNAYCQDNDLSYVDWKNADADLIAFVRKLIALRRASPVFRPRRFWVGDGDLAWFAPSGQPLVGADWHSVEAHTLGVYFDGEWIRHPGPRGQRLSDHIYLLWLHAGPLPVEVTLPGEPWAGSYEKVFDTAAGFAPATYPAGACLTLPGRSATLLHVHR